MFVKASSVRKLEYPQHNMNVFVRHGPFLKLIHCKQTSVMAVVVGLWSDSLRCVLIRSRHLVSALSEQSSLSLCPFVSPPTPIKTCQTLFRVKEQALWEAQSLTCHTEELYFVVKAFIPNSRPSNVVFHN